LGRRDLCARARGGARRAPRVAAGGRPTDGGARVSPRFRGRPHLRTGRRSQSRPRGGTRLADMPPRGGCRSTCGPPPATLKRGCPLVERRRERTPAAFLRYYPAGPARRMVLALLSYEVFLALAALAWWLGSVWVAGYLVGGAMHLALDIGFNGRLTPRNIFAFYSFGFRWAHGFDALTLFGSEPRVAPAGFCGSFFLGPRLARPRLGHRGAVRASGRAVAARAS